MKKLLLAFICCISVLNLFAQKIEVTAGIHTGFMHYAGASATSVSRINGADQANAYTNNPYGTKYGLGFGGNVQAQFIIIKTFIIGLQGNFEALKSKVDIDGASINTPSQNIGVTGSTNLRTNYLTANPYIGYRLPIPVIKLDILAGLDIAHILNSREKSSARTSDGQQFTTDRDRKTRTTDNRLKFGIAASFKKIGATANYSYGLSNYFDGYVGGPAMDTHSEIVRLGLSYRIY